MNPIEILSSPWIWYAIFGLVAVLFYLRTRRRRLAHLAAMGSGWPQDTTARTGDGEPAVADPAQPPESAAHQHGGHRHHGCC